MSDLFNFMNDGSGQPHAFHDLPFHNFLVPSGASRFHVKGSTRMFNISQQKNRVEGKQFPPLSPMEGLTPFDNVRRCYYTV